MNSVALPVLGVLLIATGAVAADPPRPSNCVNVSWGDHIAANSGDAQLNTYGKIARSLKRWKDQDDIDVILWRASAYVGHRFHEVRFTAPVYRRWHEISKAAIEGFNPLETVRREAPKNGQSFLLYMTMLDHGCPTNIHYGGPKPHGVPFAFQDRFTIEHPEFQVVDLEGNYQCGVLEMAYPESRELMVGRMVDFVNEFGSDGVYVCARTHSPPADDADQYGFSPPVVQEYRRRHGIDITEDPRFDYRSPGFARHDPAVQAWRDLRGEYLVQFFRDLRAAMPEGKRIYAGLPRGRVLGPPYGNMSLHWRTLVEDGLIDGLIVGHTSGRWLYPLMNRPHAELGYLSSEDDNLNIPSLEESVDLYAPVCREHGVKFYFMSYTYGALERKQFAALHDRGLAGFMIGAPSTASGSAEMLLDPPIRFAADGTGTIDAWVYINGYERQHSTSYILSKYDHVVGNHLRRGFEWQVHADGHFLWRANQMEPGAEGRGVDSFVKSSRPLPLGQWMHIATVFDRPRRELRLYVDGRLDARKSIPDLPLRMNPDQRLILGHYGGCALGLFDGLVDELRFSDAALKFTAPPARPYAGDEPGTVAFYRFEQVQPAGYIAANAGSRAPNLRVMSGAVDVLDEGPPGFGKALDLRQAAGAEP
ncbi:MAG: hypothetical protein JXB13_08945 [Phycisphaerae bacterium]|nr:hypothetical protein [Phycisphaerae bacterium]